MIKTAILGYGTIGSGAAEVLEINKKAIAERVGEEISLKYILDRKDVSGDKREALVTTDFEKIVNDDEVKIVIETMGGTGAAYTFVKAALEAGKSVATSNKALVAKYGTELMEIAKAKNASFLYEASVGGGIPIIRPLYDALCADEVEEISGIMNGTTNFILTKMAKEGSDFSEVLKEAQSLGFAEADPTDDVEGYDAGRKISILTSIVSGKQVNFEGVHMEGITKITAEDMKYALVLDRAIKLVATSKKTDKGYYAVVSPVMLPDSHPLYPVNGVFNAIFVKGNVLGDSMFYGSGAGMLPTASAVIADVVNIAKNLGKHIPYDWSKEELKLLNYEDMTRKFFVRASGEVKEREKEITELFGDVAFVEAAGIKGEFGFVTEEMSEKDFAGKYDKLNNKITRIRLG
ncbi:MAG: homoserine dehydrogenase [Eubacterium sp.]|nr:homoserine dehydrogenase [Eubacterium sp.]